MATPGGNGPDAKVAAEKVAAATAGKVAAAAAGKVAAAAAEEASNSLGKGGPF